MTNDTFPTKKDFAYLLRQQITSCFGLVSEQVALDTQGTSIRLVAFGTCYQIHLRNFGNSAFPLFLSPR